jgi:predicted anti-sigma-YlaC factor YlaD
MITCREVRRLQSAFLTLSLEPATERTVREHLAGCAECHGVLAEREPVTAIALRLGEVKVSDDAGFVGEVLAGLHQRKLERRLTRRRRGWVAAAAAVLLAALGGWTFLRQPSSVPQTVAAVHRRPAASAVEPAFVEVQGDGVRLYQLDTAAQGAVRVALVVDPHLEL